MAMLLMAGVSPDCGSVDKAHTGADCRLPGSLEPRDHGQLLIGVQDARAIQALSTQKSFDLSAEANCYTVIAPLPHPNPAAALSCSLVLMSAFPFSFRPL